MFILLRWQVTVLFFSIWAGVPLAIAIWPQRASASVESLEPFLHGVTHPVTGALVTEVFFNKGL